MEFEKANLGCKTEIVDLFRSTFSLSEGEHEGNLIGDLAANLSKAIDNITVICFCARENNKLIGSIFFTQLHFEHDSTVYLLAPVAIATNHQNCGVGQALIKHGLITLTSMGAKTVITYGKPSYYKKVGFEPLSESIIRAPMKLSMPFGWLGQSLTGDPIQIREESPICVEAFRNPAYW